MHNPSDSRSHRIDWEDLRMVLAVAEASSLAGAARILGVNHTTVLRRVNAFEERLGIRLFDRLPSGYALTAGGQELLATARKMAETVTELERKLSGQDLRFEGPLRVTTTDTLFYSVLPPMLAAFRERYPAVELQLAIQNPMANLTQRDADVAIRPVAQPPETLVGRRVANVKFAVYASPGYIATRETIDLAALRWIVPDDSLASSGVARWMKSALPDADIALRVDSLVAMAHCVRAGLGAAALPCYLADGLPGLVRIGPLIDDIDSALWVLTHEDLRRTARVSAFIEFMADALQRQRDLMEGRSP
ncbi:LysR family transcriptional regulator [Bradyrhizobium erythrophlei]|uniref:LysR family transcriptional regulator n=1 Tax=Bradyrhizobium erythrophlei TaxID=1437360 RepID=UPI0035ECF33F